MEVGCKVGRFGDFGVLPRGKIMTKDSRILM